MFILPHISSALDNIYLYGLLSIIQQYLFTMSMFNAVLLTIDILFTILKITFLFIEMNGVIIFLSLMNNIFTYIHKYFTVYDTTLWYVIYLLYIH